MVAKSASGTALSDITILVCENRHTGRFAARQTISDDLHSACIILMEEFKLKVFGMREVVHLSLVEVGFRIRHILIACLGLVFRQLSRNWRRILDPYLARSAAS